MLFVIAQLHTAQLSHFTVALKIDLYSGEFTLSRILRENDSRSDIECHVYIISVFCIFQKAHAIASHIKRLFQLLGGVCNISFFTLPSINLWSASAIISWWELISKNLSLNTQKLRRLFRAIFTANAFCSWDIVKFAII